jgi:hypothetical protein
LHFYLSERQTSGIQKLLERWEGVAKRVTEKIFCAVGSVEFNFENDFFYSFTGLFFYRLYVCDL